MTDPLVPLLVTANVPILTIDVELVEFVTAVKLTTPLPEFVITTPVTFEPGPALAEPITLIAPLPKLLMVVKLPT